ncbi:MAG: acyl-CoA-binding protein [Neisseriaceae bacterium]|jgi:acyl-CoA-binding protein
MSDDLQIRFDDMVKAVREATIDFNPNNAQKLKLYAFYKQATEGDVKGECPSIVNMVERAKWQAWNAIKGKSKEEAMTGYLKIFEEK